jgi:hypothetical protein
MRLLPETFAVFRRWRTWLDEMHASRQEVVEAAEAVREARWTPTSPSYSVRPNGAVHQWRKDPPRKLSVGPGS